MYGIPVQRQLLHRLGDRHRPDSYARYQALPGAFGQRVRASIQPGETPCFRMNGERCAMLNGENLCQIYRRLGKEGLCQICHDHPLFTDTFGTRRETGLGLCCEEAARLLFAQPEPLTLYATDTAEPEYSEEVEEGLVTQMTALRDHLFHLLHDRTVPINLAPVPGAHRSPGSPVDLGGGALAGAGTAAPQRTRPPGRRAHGHPGRR